jgi:hypothetical protein
LRRRLFFNRQTRRNPGGRCRPISKNAEHEGQTAIARHRH